MGPELIKKSIWPRFSLIITVIRYIIIAMILNAVERRLKVSLSAVLFLMLLVGCPRAEETLIWHDCVREAAKNHPDLIVSLQQVKQSEAGKAISASQLFPQIKSNLSASTSKASGAGQPSATQDSYAYGVSATQLIFDGLKTRHNLNAASENIKAAKESFRFTSAVVRHRLRFAFINLLKAQEMIRITQEIYDIRRSNLELITLRYESGLEHRGAFLTAEADLAQIKYEILQAQRNLEVARRQLAKEMGRPDASAFKVGDDFQIKESAEEKPDFKAIAQDNPSLKQLAAQKNAAGFGVKASYADFFPTLSGQAGASRSSSHWSPERNQMNTGLTLSLPIFEGGLRLAQISRAKAAFYQLEANERSAKDALILNLEESWAFLQDAIGNLEVQGKLLAASEERSRIAQAQYSNGFINFDSWIIIEDNLVRAKRSFLDARANALFAEAGWVQAKGETLEYE